MSNEPSTHRGLRFAYCFCQAFAKASTSLTEKPLAGAHVSIRVVSTVRPPQILFRGVTGADGIVSSVCALPDIGTGNAALIIAASSGLGNNEIKQLIRKKPR